MLAELSEQQIARIVALLETFCLACSPSNGTLASLRMWTSRGTLAVLRMCSLRSAVFLISAPGLGFSNCEVFLTGSPRTAHSSMSSLAKDSNGEQSAVLNTMYVSIISIPRIRREKGPGCCPATQEQFHSLPPLTTALGRNSPAMSLAI